MANTIKNVVLVNAKPKSVFLLTLASDGTLEGATAKVDISALPGAPARIKINSIAWAVEGLSLLVKIDRATTPVEFLLNNGGMLKDIHDTGSGAGTGDIIFSTIGNLTTSGYTVAIEVEADAG